MKKGIITLAAICIFGVTAMLAQGPPSPPSNAGENGGPVGGAPIDGGLTIFLTFAAGYIGKQIYDSRKLNKNDK